MAQLKLFYVVKLNSDPDRDCCADTDRRYAIELLCADPDVPAENRQVLTKRLRAYDAGDARARVVGGGGGPWIGGMLLSEELR